MRDYPKYARCRLAPAQRLTGIGRQNYGSKLLIHKISLKRRFPEGAVKRGGFRGSVPRGEQIGCGAAHGRIISGALEKTAFLLPGLDPPKPITPLSSGGDPGPADAAVAVGVQRPGRAARTGRRASGTTSKTIGWRTWAAGVSGRRSSRSASAVVASARAWVASAFIKRFVDAFGLIRNNARLSEIREMLAAQRLTGIGRQNEGAPPVVRSRRRRCAHGTLSSASQQRHHPRHRGGPSASRAGDASIVLLSVSRNVVAAHRTSSPRSASG